MWAHCYSSSSKDGISAVTLKRYLAARLISLIKTKLCVTELTAELLFPIHVECNLRSPLELLEATQSITCASVFGLLQIEIGIV